MRYQCLVLDHDDTVVDSTASVHYPAFMETLRRLRPGKWESLTLEEYFLYNFEPGFAEFCRDILGFTAEEDAEQGRAWEHYVAGHVPKAYPGMKEFLWRCREAGIRLCVVSHSLKENILRDWRENGLPEPEFVYGWDSAPEKRKPSPWPLKEIMRRTGLSPDALLMMDDLKPGKQMADACDVDFAAAGWAHHVPQIVEYMRRECPRYCPELRDLEAIVFGKDGSR